MEDLKSEFKRSASYKRRLQILTLSPFSAERTAEFFETSMYMVKLSRSIKKEKGIFPEIGKRSRGRTISADDEAKVVGFYESDSVSRICPGMKDYVVVKDTEGTKTRVQKRLILGTLKEIFELFKADQSNPKMSFSSFAALRPKHCVLAGSSGTHNVCVCSHHENVKLMVDALSVTDLSYRDLIDHAVCDASNADCMNGDCSDCPGTQGVLDFLLLIMADVKDLDDLDCDVKYKQWVSSDRRCRLVDVEEGYEEFLENLSAEVRKLTKHHFVADEQSKFFKKLKATVSDGEAVVVGDFSENYTFKVQNEIQSHHWNAPQCTVHPFVVYWNENGEERCKSYCFISDETKHNTSVVHAFQTQLIPEIKKIIPHLTKIYYFSDGCSGQYKNKFNFVNIAHHVEDFGVTCEWHFYATSHGKNACDGVGGTVKRATAMESLRRSSKDQILSTRDMFAFLTQQFETKIKVLLVDKRYIREVADKLVPRFKRARRVAGTQKLHRFVPIDKCHLMVYAFSGGAGKAVRIS